MLANIGPSILVSFTSNSGHTSPVTFVSLVSLRSQNCRDLRAFLGVKFSSRGLLRVKQLTFRKSARTNFSVDLWNWMNFHSLELKALSLQADEWFVLPIHMHLKWHALHWKTSYQTQHLTLVNENLSFWPSSHAFKMTSLGRIQSLFCYLFQIFCMTFQKSMF